MAWLDMRHHLPLIQQLNQTAESWRASELAKAKKMMDRGADMEQVLEALSTNLTKKMLNGPLRELNHPGAHERGRAREAVHRFFFPPSSR